MAFIILFFNGLYFLRLYLIRQKVRKIFKKRDKFKQNYSKQIITKIRLKQR
ncbi:hypothetical protein [Campylobacter gastrosuis]|uniref:Uncharacterized protein n=1 Tax=Campylobacter gastrosuis TaxID=2974576 RepID=A0ABT7HNK3_9BACT|nr:hypothetical protein [Campylobacter gastrosuis]MDL0088512.1 hypothetical protein [Campylobacter gastrosuis]